MSDVVPRRSVRWCRGAVAALAALSAGLGCSDPPIPGHAAFAVCGNKICELGEAAADCPLDCPACKPSDCLDDNPCTIDTCDAKTGCSFKEVGGGPCTKGACFEDGSCVQGQCVASPRLWQWSHDYGEGKKDTATAVVRDTDGGLLVSVEAYRDAVVGGSERDNYVLRVAASGATDAKPPTKIAVAPSPATDDALPAMAALTGGGALAVGSKAQLLPVNGKPPRTMARWAVVTGAGTAPPAEDYLKVDGDHWFLSVARATANDLLAVGAIDEKGLMQRFWDDGEPDWHLPLAHPGAQSGQLRAVVGTAGKATAWVAVGRAQIEGKLHGWAIGLPALTTNTWSKAIAADGGWQGALNAVAAAHGGGTLAAGVVCDCSFGWLPELPTARLWLVRLDEAGNVLWQRRGEQQRWPTALMALPGGSSWLAITELHADTGPNGLSILTLAADGVEKAATPVAAPRVSAATWLPDGTLALTGQIAVQGQGDAWLARLDRWGNPTCEQSATCLNQPANDCGDGNTCTADACLAGGCTHKPNPGGVGCATTGHCKGTTCEQP